MIIYFSATGNSKYVAKKIAQATNDNIMSMIECENNEKYEFKLDKGESFGVISPTYFGCLPIFVDEFLDKITITSEDEKPYIYTVCTYGRISGYSSGFIKDFLEEYGFNVTAQYTIRMVDTWTPIFDLTKEDHITKFENIAEKELDKCVKRIQNKDKGNFTGRTFPRFIANIYHMRYDSARKTKHLHPNENCVGCGMCAKRCPIQAIEMQNNRPVRITEYCVMCLRCLHKCPMFAMEYDNKTKNHGQYTNPHIVTLD